MNGKILKVIALLVLVASLCSVLSSCGIVMVAVANLQGFGVTTRYYGDGEKNFISCYDEDKMGEELVIPESIAGSVIHGVRAGGFDEVDKIKTLTVPASVEELEGEAFCECDGLESVALEGYTKIGNFAFAFCVNLSNVSIEKADIGERAFCFSDVSVLSIGAGTVGPNAFELCDIKTLTLGDGVTEIGYQAFTGCDELVDVVIPDSVTYIGSGAFYSCDSLKTVSIGSGVETIGPGTFDFCESLESVTFSDPTGWSCTVDGETVRLNELGDPALAAELLRDTYADAVWVKE